MVMRPDVLGKAVEATYTKGTKLVYFSPRGSVVTQKKVEELKNAQEVTFLCGRFEGVDQRVLDAYPFEEISLGDFVLSGGEVAALSVMDAIVRLLPNVMGSKESLLEESFSDGLLEYPHYTRPAEWNGMKVPEILLSGHHANVASFRKSEAEKITRERRPDLWQAYLEQTKNKNEE